MDDAMKKAVASIKARLQMVQSQRNTVLQKMDDLRVQVARLDGEIHGLEDALSDLEDEA